MYCANCGGRIPEGETVCPACQQPINKKTLAAQMGGSRHRAYVRECRRKRSRRRAVKWITAGVIAAAAAAAVGMTYHKLTYQPPEVPRITGRDSYTALLTDYFTAAETSDAAALVELFFPESEQLYNDGNPDAPDLQILAGEDSWVERYGQSVVDYTMGSAQFADLSSEKVTAVLDVIRGCSGLEDISELFLVECQVTYQDGSAETMTFEVVQSEQGSFLVNVT